MEVKNKAIYSLEHYAKDEEVGGFYFQETQLRCAGSGNFEYGSKTDPVGISTIYQPYRPGGKIITNIEIGLCRFNNDGRCGHPDSKNEYCDVSGVMNLDEGRRQIDEAIQGAK